MAVFALRNRFLGGPLGPSAKYPSYRSRLFRRGAYRHDESRAVHEGLERARTSGDPRGRPRTRARRRRCARRSADTWRYARLESEHVARPASALAYVKGIVLRPALKLVYRTVIDGGWRDGWRGLLKIWLDVSSDALVWARVLAGGGSSEADAGGRALRPAQRGPAEDRRRGRRARLERGRARPPAPPAGAGDGRSPDRRRHARRTAT